MQKCGVCGDHTLAVLYLQHNEVQPRKLSTMFSASETISANCRHRSAMSAESLCTTHFVGECADTCNTNDSQIQKTKIHDGHDELRSGSSYTKPLVYCGG